MLQMAAEPPTTRRFEFDYPILGTQVLVESFDDEVVIRATKDTFTEPQKQAFIRNLALEGFVSESLRWTYTGRGYSAVRVRWLVDGRWAVASAATERPRRTMTRIVVVASIAWFLLMTAILILLH